MKIGYQKRLTFIALEIDSQFKYLEVVDYSCQSIDDAPYHNQPNQSITVQAIEFDFFSLSFSLRLIVSSNDWLRMPIVWTVISLTFERTKKNKEKNSRMERTQKNYYKTVFIRPFKMIQPSSTNHKSNLLLLLLLLLLQNSEHKRNGVIGARERICQALEFIFKSTQVANALHGGGQ